MPTQEGLTNNLGSHTAVSLNNSKQSLFFLKSVYPLQPFNYQKCIVLHGTFSHLGFNCNEILSLSRLQVMPLSRQSF